MISKTQMLTLTDRERRMERWPPSEMLYVRAGSGGELCQMIVTELC